MMAYSALETLLDGAKPAKVAQRDGLTIHLFAKGKGSRAVVWSDRARPLSLPRGATAFDVMGNPMKMPVLSPNEPVYLQAPGLPPDELIVK